MGCNCGKTRIGGRQISSNGRPVTTTLGYQVTYPDGTVSPDLFLSLPEAKAEIRRRGGGTAKRVTTTSAP